MRATKSNFIGIKLRLDRIAEVILENPLTIRQISEIITSDPRTTYRDLSKMTRLAYGVKNNKGHYWIPKPQQTNP